MQQPAAGRATLAARERRQVLALDALRQEPEIDVVVPLLYSERP